MAERETPPRKSLLRFLPEPLRALARAMNRALHRLSNKLRGIAEHLRPRRVFATLKWFGQVWTAMRRRRRQSGLTVGVDANPLWSPLTGVGWYLYHLLEELAERDDLRLRLYGPELVPHPNDPRPQVRLPQGRSIEVVSYAIPDDLTLSRDFLLRSLRQMEWVLVAGDRNQILFAPNYILPPRFRFTPGALVATVHDLSVRRFPWTMNETTHRALVRNLGKTAKRAAALLTHAQTVRHEIVRDGLGRPQSVHAIPPGPGHLAQAPPVALPPSLPTAFALHVGTLEPRKNVSTVVAAWRELRRRGGAPTLVLCGDPGWKNEDIQRQIATGEQEGWIKHLGYVDDARLAALYRGALLVVCPSLYEGFGFPVVEAMVAGSPVVASDIPVFREVAGEAALFVPAQDPLAWADAVSRLTADGALRHQLTCRGRQQVSGLRWQVTAQETARIWYEAAGAGSDGPQS